MQYVTINAAGRYLVLERGSAPVSLLQVSDFEYLGAFRLPVETGSTKFGFRGGAIAYDPNDGGMFVASGSQAGTDAAYSRVCKVSIPALSLSSTIASLNRATITIESQNVITGLTYSPAYGGNENDSGAPWSMHVFGSKLIFTANQFYPSTDLLLSHGRCDLDLTNAEGMYRPNTGVDARRHNMGMCEIPAAFQADFGDHTAMATRGGGSIITRSSDGPAVMTFNSADVSATPFAATLRQFYTSGQLDATAGTKAVGNPTLKWARSNFYRGGAMIFHNQGGKYGIAMVGIRAESAHWYGYGHYDNWRNDVGTTFPAEENIPALKTGQSHYATFGNAAGWPSADDEDRYFVDGKGDGSSKGEHGADYYTGIYFYDPADVLATTTAQPYAVERLTNPFNTVGDKDTYAGDYCPSNGRLYLPIEGDTNGAERVPLILVYQLPV